MQAHGNVMVFVEHDNADLAEVSLELVSKARELAQTLGVGVEAAVFGSGVESTIDVLGRYGCQRVFVVDHPGLARFTSVPYAKALVNIIGRHDPRVVLLGGTTNGRDLAPRVASELGCGLTANCTDLQIGEHRDKGKVYTDILLQIRPAFGGNIVATIISPESRPSMATVREGVMRKLEADPGVQPEVIREDIAFTEADFPTEIVSVESKAKVVDLKGAKIVVAAGMGASDPQSLKLVFDLARALGGVVGGSRPLIDAGMLSKEHLVGQTGTTVRPNLYIACGISGQIQHRAGMLDSKRIIAINSDPQAPILDYAHYSIVGDVKEVIPNMIKAYKHKV